MSPQKRGLPSTSSGRASLLRRPRTARTKWRSSGRNLVTRSWLTEDDVRRVVREEFMGAWEHVKSDLAEYCQRCMGNAPEEIMQQKLMATVELANNHSPHLGRVDARSMGINDVRNLRLQFQTKLSDPLFTGRKLRGVGGARISVALIDANAGDVVTSILESSIKLDVVVLEGDFDKDDEDDWTHEEFKNFVVKERQQKGQLLKGDLQVTLNGGVGELGELIFTDNSSWNRSKKFRIGLKKASGYCGNTRIREAKTNAFHVKEHRGEASKKHDKPAFDDEIWRLKKIAKGGIYDQKLSEAGIHKVGDFLLQLFTDPMKLKEILGMTSNSTNWDTLEIHAKECKINWKPYLYYTDGTRNHGAIFNTDHQLVGLIKDRVYCATHRLSADDLEHGDRIVKKAHENWNDVWEFNGENFSPLMQKGSSSYIPSQVSDGQIVSLIPVQPNLDPQICPPPGGLDAHLENVNLTAEGHDDVWYPDTDPGNHEVFSIDEFMKMDLISSGDIFTNVGFLAQNPDPHLRFAMPDQMIHSWSQTDYIVNGLPSGPTSASTSSFQCRRALPLPAGIYGMEDFQSPDPYASTANGLAASEKHDIPAFDDEIWRLKTIAKDGKYHQKLSEAGIHKVGDFLLQLFTDPMKLKEILGMTSNSTNWDTLESHAKSCKINWKLYWYYTDGTRNHGAVFDTNHQLIGLIKDRVYCATHRLSADDLEHGNTLVKKAVDNWNDVWIFNGENFSPSMQKKSSSSIPCEVFEGQIENLTPVQSNLAPQICAAPGGPEAPVANVGLTAKVFSPGHNGATALALPVQLKSTNSGTALKLSVDESVRPAKLQPISTDPLNVLISQGDNGIPTGRLPEQSHGNNFQYAMQSHTICSSSQMHHTVNENALPSEPPPSASISRLHSSSTLPPPEGNLVMGNCSEDIKYWLETVLSQSSPYDDKFWKTPVCYDGSVSGTSKCVNGWFKIKAVMQWGTFVRRIATIRGARIVQSNEPPIEV
ncbi:hypothetical protein EUGRSUZ_A00446 [Eucalyptus grandis]|uniref:Uncharacterized protein n=2 Tax=Eucalyptus grandis TaxID=71139 RepID=A0ACC3M118_EUCGR|nr:hypothetical protein EUGRSUZ_A00446 [Eucalyptus grandis]